MRHIRRDIICLTFLLASIQSITIQAAVGDLIDEIKSASVEDLAQALAGNENELQVKLSGLVAPEQEWITLDILNTYRKIFAGYYHGKRSLTLQEKEYYIPRFEVVPTKKWIMYNTDHLVPYAIINRMTNDLISQSPGWATYAFNHDESLVVHDLKEGDLPIEIINTQTKEKWCIPYPQGALAINDFAFTHDNRYLIVASFISIYVYDLKEARYYSFEEDSDEHSLGTLILALNKVFHKNLCNPDDLGRSLKLQVTTSPCGKYISFIAEKNEEGRIGARLYIYHVKEKKLKKVFFLNYIELEYIPSKLRCCFSKNGDFLALRSQFREDSFRSPTIVLVKSKTGECCLKTKVDRLITLKLNEDGSQLVANFRQAESDVWEYRDLNVLESDLDFTKTLFVYLLAKWHAKYKSVCLYEVEPLIAVLKQFTYDAQLFLKQKYNIKTKRWYWFS